jgi:polygalacturonase
MDSTIIHQSTFSPFDWSGTLNVAFSSEASHAASEVPGSTSNPEDLDTMEVQNYADDDFYDTCTNVYLEGYNDNPGVWAHHAPACDHVNIWTIR